MARDENDDRAITVPVSALRNVHWATDCGGKRQPLSKPTLAGYMDPALIAGQTFGYDGQHRYKRTAGDLTVRIKVLVQDRTAPEVIAVLTELAKSAKGRKNFRWTPR